MFRLKLYRVIILTIGWAIIGVLVAIYDHLVYLMFYADTPGYTFFTALMTNLLGGALGGGLGAIATVFYLKKWSEQRPFLVVICVNTLTYAAIILIMIFLLTFLFQSRAYGLPFTHPTVAAASRDFLLGPGALKFLLLWTAIAGFTSLLLEVSDKYGPGVLGSYIIGKYHQPRPEVRCFMFLDIASSTTIAEQLGHVAYFRLLKQFFADATEPILESGGTIYQYVGDEIVASWSRDQGCLNANCIRCFFAIQDVIKEKAAAYMDEFGITVEFRAGIHFGEVTIGEIGTMKKDIIFTGDVLNTTARIQGKCRELGVSLLISDDLYACLNLKGHFVAKEIGSITLRGKTSETTLYAVERATT